MTAVGGSAGGTPYFCAAITRISTRSLSSSTTPMQARWGGFAQSTHSSQALVHLGLAAHVGDVDGGAQDARLVASRPPPGCGRWRRARRGSARRAKADLVGRWQRHRRGRRGTAVSARRRQRARRRLIMVSSLPVADCFRFRRSIRPAPPPRRGRPRRARRRPRSAGHVDAAGLERQRAARVEGAARRRGDRVGDLALDRPCAARPLMARSGSASISRRV